MEDVPTPDIVGCANQLPDLLDGALGAKGALGISCSPVSQFHQTLLDGLEGMGGGEPYSEPSQQVEEAEVTGESFTHHDRTPMAKGATFDPGP